MRFTTYCSLFLPIHSLLLSNRKVTVSHFGLIPGRLRELAVMLCGQEKHNISRVSQNKVHNHVYHTSCRWYHEHQHYHHSRTDSSQSSPQNHNCFSSHLGWYSLKMYFYPKLLLCQREDKQRKKMERIWQKILELKSYWSLTVRSHRFSA